MNDSPTILGIDVGAVSVALCELSLDGEPLKTAYEAHQGDVRGVLSRMLATVALPQVGWLACTGTATSHVKGGGAVDQHLAHVAAVRQAEPEAGTVLVLGGERFSIIRFDGQGAYRGSQTNSSCAAGTGSFLDQYARTLGFADGAELASAALRAGDVAPPIASRCAVFAKTDLIHAQQQGYSREAICNGLCDGLAAIVADTVLSGPAVAEPIVLSGGVALNQAVVHHLARRLGRPVQAGPDAHLDAARGAALVLRDQLADPLAAPQGPGSWRRPEDLLAQHRPAEVTRYEPLGLPSDGYPSFDDHPSYLFEPRVHREAPAVEVDVYLPATSVCRPGGILGIDVGSTSTKAVLVDDRRQVLLGLYTRTTGRPIVAVQALFEALADWLAGAPGPFEVAAAATTGAGRKLVGAVVGAELVVDEITAHARAATELRPDVDTIIEIGGQDAKFTTLRRGTVTSAFMNTVCAAGTGSFLEEQARQLGCTLGDYGNRVAAARAPYASDRCTVFMQRDISHLLGAGHAVSEVLASVLHSVRDNYLQRVAREASIGSQICFQGATAKNPALVAAFEQRLGRPIAVSRYCHLTGALGAALLLAEQTSSEPGRFRGLGLAGETIVTANERCALCRNRCVITTATIGGQQVAYGFRCGRDLDTKRYVSANRSGFTLARSRRAVERRLGGPAVAPASTQTPTVGIPAALQLYDQLPFWKRFFAELGVPVVTSEGLEAPVSQGKRIAKAEFCAPMTAFHAHVTSLTDRADFIFTPILLEGPRPDRRSRRQFCFYSQYASALIESLGDPQLAHRTLSPQLVDQRTPVPSVRSLTTALRPLLGETLSHRRVAQAFRAAQRHAAALREQLQALMDRERPDRGQLAVVLLGRPYTCLPAQMNKGIPDIIAALGVKAFFQDMIRPAPEHGEEIAELLQTVHWHFAAEILTAACVVARTPGLYPVLVTSFKCTPDACTVDYVQRLCDRYDKPYLVLELDEHDSALGYETRIEAGIAAFRNHHARAQRRPRAPRPQPIHHPPSSSVRGRTLFLPKWDDLACPLLAANLNRVGIPTHLLADGPDTTQRGMRRNSGQCAPLTIIAQGFIEAVEEQGMDPGQTVLWCIESQIACNLGMFASVLRSMLADYGRGFERATVFPGEISMVDVTLRGTLDVFFAYMFAGYLRRMACRLRPYERQPGETDRALAAGLAAFQDVFAGKRPKLAAVVEVVDRFAAIAVTPRNRPRVAIFGDMFTRDNDSQNQDLLRFIEEHGGEAVTTPYSEYMKVVAESYFRKWLREGRVVSVAVHRSLLATARHLERRFAAEFSRVLGPLPRAALGGTMEAVLAPYGVTERHTGETLDNLLKISSLLHDDPDLSLFVQANPAFCCPSLVTEAMSARIEKVTGVPVVTVTYDGTAAPKNDVIVPYLAYARSVSPRRPS